MPLLVPSSIGAFKPGGTAPRKLILMTGTREQRIQQAGTQILNLIPKSTFFDIFTIRGIQDYLLRLSMKEPECRTRLFDLVTKSPEIMRPRDLKIARKEAFGDEKISMPWLMKLGIRGLPASMFYLPYKMSVHSMGNRFIAGADMEKALPNIRRLEKSGFGFTLDVLGEAVKNEEAAEINVKQYLNNIRVLSKSLGKTQANFSLKLTGISLDVSEANIDGVKANLRQVLREIVKAKAFLRIDMEHYVIKDLTFRIFKEIMEEDEFYAYEDIGIVVQTYLKDSVKDAEDMIAWAKKRFRVTGGTRTAIRLVKGANNDSDREWAEKHGLPDPICKDKPTTDANFERITRMFLENHKYFKMAFGTHNVRSVAAVVTIAKELNVPMSELEFQLLYGMGEPILEAMIQFGCKARVYAPVGEIEAGTAYLVRRLLENSSKTSMLVNLQNFLVGKVSIEELLAPPKV